VSDVEPHDIGTAVRQVLGDSLAYLYPAALRAAVRACVAEHLSDGPMTAGQLAALAGVQAEPLRRVLRLLATHGVFREDDGGMFHLTSAASLLRGDAPVSVRSLVLLFTDQMYWLPAGRLEDTVRKGETVFGDLFGSRFFDHLPDDEERAETFYAAMAELSVTEQGAIAGSYEFPETGTVVDIAGGRGGMLHAVLARNPGLRGVLFEREPLVRHHKLDDPALAGRWETAVGDFFTAVPPGADIYLLKRILHDKTDTDSVRILRSCREAMSDGARLLIIDAVVPTDGRPHPSVISDVLMLAVFEGRERTAAELSDLLLTAGLRLGRVIDTPVTLSIAEAVIA